MAMAGFSRAPLSLALASWLTVALSGGAGAEAGGESAAGPLRPSEVTAALHENPLDRLPSLLVSFRSDAGGKVAFEMEWTEAGKAMSADLTGRAVCPSGGADRHSCTALKFFTVRANQRDVAWTNERGRSQGFIVRDLAYGGDYCFRFRTRDVASRTVSGWSDTACMTAPSPHAAPLTPGILEASVVRPKSEDTSAERPVALFRWTSSEQNTTAGFEIERGITGTDMWAGVASVAFAQGKKGDTGHIFQVKAGVPDNSSAAPNQPYRFRLCAVNVTARTCAEAIETVPVDG